MMRHQQTQRRKRRIARSIKMFGAIVFAAAAVASASPSDTATKTSDATVGTTDAASKSKTPLSSTKPSPKPSAKTPSRAGTKTAAAAKPLKKRYRSSAGGPATTAKTRTATSSTRSHATSTTTSTAHDSGTAGDKPTPAKSGVKAKAAAVRRHVIPRGPAVSASTRAEAHEGVFQKVANGADLPVENAAALIPFFEQLYRHQRGEMTGPLSILHYGDSHVAADELTGDLREHFQGKFGDGGSGYSLAGRPWNGYRRFDVRSGSTRGWHSDGLVGRAGDGIYGLGGVSMSTKSPHEAAYLLADCQEFELFYLQQPEGGALQLYDNGSPVERISTAGDLGAGYYHYETTPGTHRFEVETLDRAPVRLFGWVAENTTGVTYETLGINGASASIVMNWDAAVLRSNIERRDPALIVLAYGTNEAGRKDWTLESYRDMFSQLIARFRQAAPAATILVTGPPDRYIHTRKGWQPMDNIDMIVEAQRQAAAAAGCAFWDMRAKMGGKGSMQQWLYAGMAQNDHVHFTGPGYRMLGDAIFRDVMSQYEVFLKARDSIADAPPSEARPTSVAGVAH